MIKEPVEVSIGQLEDILDKYLDAGAKVNYAVKIVGHPGTGKSAIVKQVAESKEFQFIDTRLAFKENIDLGGYPVPDHDERCMLYYRPKFIPAEAVPENYNGILWFLDESNRAHPTVIQTLFQIITEKKCGEHQLPENTAVVLSGNLGEADHTTITQFDDSALDARLAIFHLKPNAGEWLSWAVAEDIHPAVVNYISLFPEKLWDEENIYPNPRGWHQISNAIKFAYGIKEANGLSEYLLEHRESSLEKTIISLAGSIAARDFILQHTTPRALTSSDVLTGVPERLELLKGGKIPAEDLLWALAGALSVIREEKAFESGPLTEAGLLKLANFLKFTGYSRSDISISFFYFLIKECGIFTEIPRALKTINDEDLSNELMERLSRLLDS